MRFIKTEHQEQLGVLQLDNDKKSNSLNLKMIDEMVEKFTQTLARRITINAPLAISLIKTQVHQLATQTVEQITQDKNNREFVRRVFLSHNFREGKQAFLEKRKPLFKGK